MILTHSLVSNVSPASNLVQLTYLDLTYNEITDVTPLNDAIFPDIYHLELEYQNISYPAIQIDDSMTIENIAKGFDGQLIPPVTISDSGSYDAPYVQWAGLG